MQSLRPLLQAAAEALEATAAGPRRGAPAAGPVAALLDALGLAARPDGPRAAAAARGDAALLRAAARFERLFQLGAEDAPGLHAMGGEVDLAAAAGETGLGLASASGVGATPGDAFRACVGEGVELLSSVEAPEDRVAMRPEPPPEDAARADPALRRLLNALPWPEGGRNTPWLPAIRLTDGARVWLPRDVALRTAPARRAFGPPPWPPSIGCAAGPTPEAAALHALLELVERDAAALWWRGGRRPRPLALEGGATAAAVALLDRLRGDRLSRRRSWLLDVTTDLGVPVVAAVSFAPDGTGFCCGVAARTARSAAARAAILEMAQMELAHALVLAKRQGRGEAALNAADHAHLRRFSGIHAARCALVHPSGPPAAAGEEAATEAAGANGGDGTAESAALGALVRRLGARGLAPILLDFTRPALGIPAVRVLCPGLEVEPSALAGGDRLRAARAETGGGDGQTGGIALM